ncbi:hypothetical protein JIN84_17915 [Luteolibacter yonseiensis]|uniref:Uncharacterized protein n=1 Tax=Luteolibacter yonseiensis TaxID=1144680 RepID=A0A934R6Z5_9BACT|nr:hypothetical protein [Luteolibacter yonseiensis]MBK1817502.1 hypothetical protein [Luteolibacter yonseiensis]
MNRNPDIDLDNEAVPPGYALLEGKLLMATARAAKIPFGLATRRVPCSNSHRKDTVGLILRAEDLQPMKEALERKITKRTVASYRQGDHQHASQQPSIVK